ncbi:hypothetical protein ACUNWD_17970 [Sunxiuqinia sp. A32]|uniref:hypothetical protein n=1 Tax=Sunxiuqinia sp. A32 TaxID=3461496 RepID=UPI004045F6D7
MNSWIKNRKLRRLLKKQIVNSPPELNKFIADLKKCDYSVIQSIGVLCKKLHIGLNESRDIVLNSPSWIHDKDRIIDLNNKAWETLKQEADEVKLNDDGTESLVFNVKENEK